MGLGKVNGKILLLCTKVASSMLDDFSLESFRFGDSKTASDKNDDDSFLLFGLGADGSMNSSSSSFSPTHFTCERDLQILRKSRELTVFADALASECDQTVQFFFEFCLFLKDSFFESWVSKCCERVVPIKRIDYGFNMEKIHSYEYL
ncbi:MAG: hypothetical protein GY820_22135 [Gammaproteobacteria bacterium]|nr:hypothetical protein [Gammaproteobacteria bacterium]